MAGLDVLLRRAGVSSDFVVADALNMPLFSCCKCKKYFSVLQIWALLLLTGLVLRL